MKKKAILLMLVLMFISTNAVAQSFIFGQMTGDVHAGIQVELWEESSSCGADELYATFTTNSEGYYFFENLDNDTYKVVPNDESYIFTPEFHTVQIPNATFYTNRNFYAVSYNPPCAGVGNDRLIDNNDGTVTDVCTGLIWIQDASCYVFGVEATWEIANVVASTISSGECGLSDNSIEGDWRLPGFHEWWRLGEDPPDYEPNFYTHPWEVDQSLIHIERAVKYHIGYDKKWTFEHYNASHQTTSEDNAILRKSWLVRDPN